MMEATMERVTLNEHQKRHLRTSCKYADNLLSNIEAVLNSASSGSPFEKYRDDLSPAQRKVARDYIARIRAQMTRALEGQEASLSGERISAIHSIRTALEFIDIAVEELKPKYMRGYGELPSAIIPELNGIVGELQAIVKKFDAYLAQGLGQDLQGRLARLEQTGDEIELLKTLERIVSERGLVEYRPALSMIVDRLAESRFEIALFGRVSSGKSSLLNYILGSPVLPVGVNPITSVPTRVVYGEKPRLIVSYAEKGTEKCELERLPEFVTEQHNPANAKHVTRLIVELPSPRLRSGVVFVDTPGLGSLASSGAAETMAYLPQCDLGVMLIDAGSTLTQEDITTVRTLYEAAIPASALLSKADLLAPEDRMRAVNYIAEQLRSQLRLDIPVRAVSAITEHAELLERWFEEEIAPLYDRHQQLARQSLRRKIGALRETVTAALRVELNRSERQPRGENPDLKAVETKLRRATGYLEETRLECERMADEIAELGDEALGQAAAQVAEHWTNNGNRAGPFTPLVVSTVTQAAAEKAKTIYDSFETLAGRLARSLGKTAKALDLNDAPEEQELLASVREAPRLDLGAINPDLRFAWLSAFGKSMAKHRVESRLQKQVGQAVTEAFSVYGRLLRAWATNTLREMQNRFDAHADAYRAQLARQTLGGETSAEEAEKLHLDLEELRAGRGDAPQAGKAEYDDGENR
jgi:GTP-binding protein EngB required for normal cell division